MCRGPTLLDVGLTACNLPEVNWTQVTVNPGERPDPGPFSDQFWYSPVDPS